MMLLGYLVFSGFFTVDLLRAVAENTTFVISVMEFGAVRTDAAAHSKKEFCSNQHAESPPRNRPQARTVNDPDRSVLSAMPV
jgi:hypothetical protein